ncbi:MAG TPA: hypothetical protein VFW23_16345 [Tepidisphaeraceae bacterium]|nr:hypothetical protein [Tepidisphaeraceae bacterium]
MTDPPIELSMAGEQRKESILAMAKIEASQRRRRKRAAQTLAAAIILALLIPAVFLHTHHRQSLPVAVHVHSHDAPQIEKTISKSKILVIRIETDPQIIERLAIPSQPPRWKKIGDDELLRDLASAHRPAGLAYVGDNRPVLLFRSPNTSSGG